MSANAGASGESKPIKFGTDGWRGVIAEDFNFERVRLVAAALADRLVEEGLEGKPVFIGFDRRFLSGDFARAVAEVMAGAGFPVRLSKTYVPTPAISLAVRAHEAACGVMLTASHNPGRWNGFKVKESFGGSARPETTAKLEARVAARMQGKLRVPRMPFDEASRAGKVELVDFGADYRKALAKIVDLKTIAKAGFRIVCDPMHGAGAGFLARVLADAGCDVTEIRGEENPLFGGVNPEPIRENLHALVAAMAERRASDEHDPRAQRDDYDGDEPRTRGAKKGGHARHSGRGGRASHPTRHAGVPVIGLANDGDADRIGAVDEELVFFDSHRIFATILRHLLTVRRLPGAVAQTFSSTVMVRRLAKKHGVDRLETPIGFKHIAELMLKGNPPILMGGEESGGLGFSFHLPERDGALSGLLLLEACAHAGLPPRALLEKVFEDVGHWEYDRIDLHLDPSKSAEIVARVKTMTPAEIAGEKVADRQTLDGVKFVFENDAWLLLRPSGTEPVLRVYCEAPTRERVDALLAAGRAFAET